VGEVVMTAVELLPPGAGPHDERWHELRRVGVTASEIAIVMGISPYESPFSLYWQKVNDWRWDGNEYTSAGQHLEPSIADWWAAQNPGRVVHPAGLYCHPERPWQLATPDRFICDPQWHDNPFPDNPNYEYDHIQDAAIEALLECKWVAYSWDGWGEEGTDEVPVHYRAQALWQLDVLGVDEVHFAALGPGGFRSYLVRRDEADLAVMRKAGEDFVRRLTEGDPPPLDSHTATLGALKRLHPEVGDGEIAVSGTLAVGYTAARMKRKEAEESIAECEAEIRALLGSTYARAVWDGRTVASRSVFEQRRIDSARLRKEQPEVAEAYTTVTTVDKLTPGRAKK
jgi:putative phage-type endonuclease